jgi:hypothetical protein
VPRASKRMTASCSYDSKGKTEQRLSGSDPHGAIQIRSFGGKMKIVNLWLMSAPCTLLGDRPLTDVRFTPQK